MVNGPLWCSDACKFIFRLMLDVKDVGEKWIEHEFRRNVILAAQKRFCYGLRQPPSQGHTSTARWPCYSVLIFFSVIAGF